MELSEATSEQGSLPPEEQAALTFQGELPIFQRETDDLTKNQLRRVLLAVVESPLNAKPFTFFDTREKSVFDRAMKLKTSQLVMLRAALEQAKARPKATPKASEAMGAEDKPTLKEEQT